MSKKNPETENIKNNETIDETVNDVETIDVELNEDVEIKEEDVEKKDSKKEKKSKTKLFEKKVSQEEYDKLKEKSDKVEATYQKLLADLQNIKKRNAEEVIDAKNKGKFEVFKEIVDIVDNFDRSMQFDVNTEEFKKGMEMLQKMFKERLALAGLEEVRHEGVLDPSIHQAISVGEEEDFNDNEILQVLQKGYKIEDKIIRPAMVKVNQKNENNDK